MTILKLEKQKIQILIIEDEKAIRRSFKILLKREGYQVETAANAEEAKSCFKEQRFDLLLVDLFLPKTLGIDLIRDLQATEPFFPPFVFITGEPDMNLVIESMKLKPADYLIKPVEKATLLSTIERILIEFHKKTQIYKSWSQLRESFVNLRKNQKHDNDYYQKACKEIAEHYDDLLDAPYLSILEEIKTLFSHWASINQILEETFDI